jgi:hypothetical protein
VPRYALGFHLDPPPGSGVCCVGFGAGSLACDQNGNRAGYLKIMDAKNFSIPTKSGIINLRVKTPLSIVASRMTGENFAWRNRNHQPQVCQK